MLNQNVVMAGMVAIALCLAGCGNRTPANVVPEDAGATAPTAPAASTAPPAATPVVAAPPVAYSQPVTGSLVVSGVNLTKKGLIFRTMTAAGSVVNSSNVALSGTLKVQFKKKGLLSSTLKDTTVKSIVVPSLQPGQSFPFTVTADKSGDDDAECTVETNQPAATTAAPTTGAAAAMMTTGTAY
ncbi:MAG: hypothetical protein JWM80_4571 [Cyanobacteria bacterium RYN_339]|nr:hypothetical protein [Cyanobacteria bacterium RYN_339]